MNNGLNIFFKYSLTLRLRYSPAKQNIKTSIITVMHANPVFTKPTFTSLLIDCFIKRSKKLHELRYRSRSIHADTTILTAITRNPSKQMTNVFQNTCIKAIKEKSLSRFLENKITLLCLSISIPILWPEDL